MALPSDRPARRARPRPARLLPAALGATTVLLALATAVLDLVNTSADRTAVAAGVASSGLVAGLVMTGCGAVVLWHRPRHGVGLVLAAFGMFWVLDSLCQAWSAFGAADGLTPPGGALAYWVLDRAGAALLLALPWLLLVYPDGRLVRGGGRWYARLVLAAAALLPVAMVLAPAAAVYPPGSAAPLAYRQFDPLGVPLDAESATSVLLVARSVTFASLAAALVAVVLRYRRSSTEDQRRLRWLVWAGAVCLVTVAVALLLPGGWVPFVSLLVAVTVTSVSATVGVLRPELADVDALLASTLVWAGVAAVVLAVDAAVLAVLTNWLGGRLDTQQLLVVVLLVAVVLYAPVRHGLGRLVRRLLFGRRAERYDVVSSLAARLEESADIDEQLPTLASAVATTFKLGFARVEVLQPDGETVAATHGASPARTRALPIAYRGELIGRLVLPATGVRALLSARDQALLVDVSRQAAMAVRSSRLAAELQHSRERLVLSREEDRRRIRRNLHDGLGPALGGVALGLDAAGNAVRADPQRAEQLLTRARADVREALADVRRLVHDLRPPALDDLGLRGALEQQLDRARSAPLAIALEMGPLPALPAAVEVAAYRIVAEAVTNVVRHAAAGRALVQLEVRDGALEVVVSDDGRGIGPDVGAGVGLRSLRERADELGGRCEVVCPAAGGTRVAARLPLGAPAGGVA